MGDHREVAIDSSVLEGDSRAGAILATALACLLSFATFLGAVPLRTHPLIEELQGDWKGTGPPGEIVLGFYSHTLRFYVREDFWYEATFTLSSEGDPAVLHATITDSAPPRQDLGDVVPAIVKIEDGTLSLAVDDGSDEPPESFAAAMSRYDFRRTESGDPKR
ncbi:MAG: hypothetical protein DWQ36_20535 [Acidobacteria bacterium]|nr:MAG: hypothetical protein DWQ30_20960 [Acidobacteriota bacterium]REK03258.1 MAG: hypothetical protein DWQ36_20535 [Acidobacteriota bacterium]